MSQIMIERNACRDVTYARTPQARREFSEASAASAQPAWYNVLECSSGHCIYPAVRPVRVRVRIRPTYSIHEIITGFTDNI